MTAAIRFSGVLAPPPRVGWPERASFEIEEGRFVVVMTTPNVSTGLVRLMVGLREPVEGTVEVLGVQPGGLDRYHAQRHRRRLGVGFDEPSGMVSNLTLRMNMVVPMLYSGMFDMLVAQRKTAEVLDACGLTRWADFRPADVPPDVRHAAVIARAIVRDPELLLLEEPVATLSDERADLLLRLCRERAKTIFLTTTEREGIQFDFADFVLAVDENGVRKVHHEVGVV